MRTRVFRWLGRQFVELSGESSQGQTIAAETEDLFQRYEKELAGFGFSLENTVRTRLWGKDPEARTLGTAARSKILGTKAKASSSSFVSQSHFDSGGRVALDLLAMRSSRPDSERRAVEFEPRRNYLCYLRYDSLVFLSGFTSEAETLEDQVAQVLNAVAGGLIVAATGWDRLIKLSVFLQRGQKLQTLNNFLEKGPVIPEACQLELGWVDGFAGDKHLVEIEATAACPGSL